ncbi:MAG: hypothetical protein HQL11_02885 [Candidatus Omnitrophica bacterium]|nr:hypothetical protein [Candidatus Omnitrophota bacterium]
MRGSGRTLQVLAAALCLMVAAGDGVWAEAVSGLPEVAAAGTIRDLAEAMPAEAVTIDEVYDSADPEAAQIVLVADAHTNVSAQLHLAQMLEKLILDFGIRTVLTEAGWGDNSLTFLRQEASREERRRTALWELKKGEMKGPEYLSLATDEDFVILGVEDAKLYGYALGCYRRVAALREAALDDLARMRAAARNLEDRVWPPVLRKFSDQRAAYLRGELPVSAYARYLREMPEVRAAAGVGRFDALEALARLEEKERGIDFERAEAELLEVMEGYRRADESREAEDAGPETGRVGPWAAARASSDEFFWEQLDERLRATGKPAAAELELYLDYRREAGRLDPRRLLRAMNAAENLLVRRLARSGIQRGLWEVSRALRVLENRVRLQSTPLENAGLIRSPERFDPVRITAFLNALTLEENPAHAQPLRPRKKTGEALRVAGRFYDFARKRDTVFLRNLIRLTRGDSQLPVVLITGGFHTQNLKRLLRHRGMSYVSVMPKIFHETDTNRYERLLLGQDVRGISSPRTTAFRLSSWPVSAMDVLNWRIRKSPEEIEGFKAALAGRPVPARPAAAMASGSRMNSPQMPDDKELASMIRADSFGDVERYLEFGSYDRGDLLEFFGRIIKALDNAEGEGVQNLAVKARNLTRIIASADILAYFAARDRIPALAAGYGRLMERLAQAALGADYERRVDEVIFKYFRLISGELQSKTIISELRELIPIFEFWERSELSDHWISMPERSEKIFHKLLHTLSLNPAAFDRIALLDRMRRLLPDQSGGDLTSALGNAVLVGGVSVIARLRGFYGLEHVTPVYRAYLDMPNHPRKLQIALLFYSQYYADEITDRGDMINRFMRIYEDTTQPDAIRKSAWTALRHNSAVVPLAYFNDQWTAEKDLNLVSFDEVDVVTNVSSPAAIAVGRLLDRLFTEFRWSNQYAQLVRYLENLADKGGEPSLYASSLLCQIVRQYRGTEMSLEDAGRWIGELAQEIRQGPGANPGGIAGARKARPPDSETAGSRAGFYDLNAATAALMTPWGAELLGRMIEDPGAFASADPVAYDRTLLELVTLEEYERYGVLESAVHELQAIQEERHSEWIDGSPPGHSGESGFWLIRDDGVSEEIRESLESFVRDAVRILRAEGDYEASRFYVASVGDDLYMWAEDADERVFEFVSGLPAGVFEVYEGRLIQQDILSLLEERFFDISAEVFGGTGDKFGAWNAKIVAEAMRTKRNYETAHTEKVWGRLFLDRREGQSRTLRMECLVSGSPEGRRAEYRHDPMRERFVRVRKAASQVSSGSRLERLSATDFSLEERTLGGTLSAVLATERRAVAGRMDLGILDDLRTDDPRFVAFVEFLAETFLRDGGFLGFYGAAPKRLEEARRIAREFASKRFPEEASAEFRLLDAGETSAPGMMTVVLHREGESDSSPAADTLYMPMQKNPADYHAVAHYGMIAQLMRALGATVHFEKDPATGEISIDEQSLSPGILNVVSTLCRTEKPMSAADVIRMITGRAAGRTFAIGYVRVENLLQTIRMMRRQVETMA